MTQEKENLTDIVISYLRNFAGAIGLVGGISFISGYLISNFYIGKFGVTAFNLVQSRYFTTGGLFLILISISLLGPVASFAIIDSSSSSRSGGSVIKNMVLILMGFGLSYVTMSYSGNILTGLNSNTNFLLPLETRRNLITLGLIVTNFAFFTPVAAYYLSKWAWVKLAKKKFEDIPAWYGLFFSGFTVFIFVVGLWLFSEFVYSYIPSSLGGNAPTEIQLILSDYLSHLDGYPVKLDNGISETVTLIDQTPSSTLVVLPETNMVIEIPNSEIKSIIH